MTESVETIEMNQDSDGNQILVIKVPASDSTNSRVLNQVSLVALPEIPIKQYAHLMGWSIDKVRNKCIRQHLPHRKCGKDVMIILSALDEEARADWEAKRFKQ